MVLATDWCLKYDDVIMAKMMTVVMATLPAPTVTASYSCVFHDDVDTANDVMFAFLSSPSTVL